MADEKNPAGRKGTSEQPKYVAKIDGETIIWYCNGKPVTTPPADSKIVEEKKQE